MENESAHGRPIVVQRFMALSELSTNTCQILFIDRKSIDRLPDVLALTKGQMVLTVGDSRGFAEKGGMINLSREKNRIKIEINTEAVKRADLKLNSKLLQLARIVDAPPTSGGD